MSETRSESPWKPREPQSEILSAAEVIALLGLARRAPKAPREALRLLVRKGRLRCLRSGPGPRSRMTFLRRHVEEFIERCSRWAEPPPTQDTRRQPDRRRQDPITDMIPPTAEEEAEW
ncbi:MAG: hypothetical protein BIFFINMI_02343 [Phycisphaerae bacterium]|nr:hypothetical protein [Phycisphaerae bacterium]